MGGFLVDDVFFCPKTYFWLKLFFGASCVCFVLFGCFGDVNILFQFCMFFGFACIRFIFVKEESKMSAFALFIFLLKDPKTFLVVFIHPTLLKNPEIPCSHPQALGGLPSFGYLARLRPGGGPRGWPGHRVRATEAAGERSQQLLRRHAGGGAGWRNLLKSSAVWGVWKGVEDGEVVKRMRGLGEFWWKNLMLWDDGFWLCFFVLWGVFLGFPCFLGR